MSTWLIPSCHEHPESRWQSGVGDFSQAAACPLLRMSAMRGLPPAMLPVLLPAPIQTDGTLKRDPSGL